MSGQCQHVRVNVLGSVPSSPSWGRGSISYGSAFAVKASIYMTMSVGPCAVSGAAGFLASLPFEHCA
jgi:hypothetical protein